LDFSYNIYYMKQRRYKTTTRQCKKKIVRKLYKKREFFYIEIHRNVEKESQEKIAYTMNSGKLS